MRALMQARALLLPTLIEHAARWHGEAEVVSRLVDGRVVRYGYAAAAARCRRLAHAVRRLGLGPGDVAGSLAWSHFRHFELFYGVTGTGAVLHTVNPRLFPEQIAYCIGHAEDQVLFVDPATLPLAEALHGRLPAVHTYVMLAARAEMPASALPNLLCYEDLLAGESDDFAWPDLDERSPAIACYTSGTTGDPKGVLYGHRGTVLQAMAACSPDAFAVSGLDTLLPVAPLFHCNGWSSPFTGAISGAKLVLPGRAFDAASLHALIVGEGVTFALAVPTIWLEMLAWTQERGLGLGRLERVACGGSAPPPAMIERLWFDHGVRLTHAWGMTETTAGCTFSPLRLDGDGKPDYASMAMQGRPAWGTELALEDAAGCRLPFDGTAIGELLVAGHWVAAGYHKGARRPDGWLATGDVGSVDPQGRLRLTDRAKDVIKSGGEWISSIDLENAAVAHPAVREAAVIAVPHPKWQERPLLLAVLAPGARLTADELRDFLAARVARWWLPEQVLFVDELPHTATGKIRKTELRARYAAGRDDDEGEARA